MINVKSDAGGLTLEVRGSLSKELGSFAVYRFTEADGTTSTLEDLSCASRERPSITAWTSPTSRSSSR